MKHKISQTLFLLACCMSFSLLAVEGEYEGSSFNAVWQALAKQNAETELPEAQVSTVFDMGFLGRAIKRDAHRTLSTKFDLFSTKVGVAPKRKLVHPHGVCYRGRWEVTEESEFTGLFEKGTKAAIILRSSEAMGYVKRGNYRAFGLAGKLFPGVDPDNLTDDGDKVVTTADFFTVDDLGGTLIENYFESSFTNEPPVSIGINTAPNIIAVGVVTAKVFGGADSHAGHRQLYPLAEAGLADPKQAVSPTHMRLVGGDFGRIKDYKDFRNEARIKNHKQAIEIGIELGESKDGPWTGVGTLTLVEDVASEACDQKLHFFHPKWRD